MVIPINHAIVPIAVVLFFISNREIPVTIFFFVNIYLVWAAFEHISNSAHDMHYINGCLLE